MKTTIGRTVGAGVFYYLILVCLGAIPPALAQDGLDSSSMPTSSADDSISTEETMESSLGFEQTPSFGLSLYDIWFNRNSLLSGDAFVPNKMMRAEEEFKRLNEARLDQGIRQPQVFSAALVREGYQFLWAEDPISAIDSFSKAIDLDPNNSQAYYGRGRAYLTKSIFNLGTWMIEMIRGYVAGFSDFWVKLFRLGDFYFTTLIAVALWVLTLVIIFFIKYQALWNHDLGELIPLQLHSSVIAFIGIMIALLPLFFGKGFLALILFWLVLVWVYFEKVEKGLCVVLIVIMLALPTILTYGVSFFQMYNNRSVHAMLGTYYGGWDPRVANFLITWSDKHPSDMEPYFLLGMLYRKQGNYFEAKKEYEKALRLDPGNAKILNNMGNIYYFLNDNQQAIDNLKKAYNSDMMMASSHYNISKAYLAIFEFTKSDSELSEARALNRELIDAAEDIYSSTPNRKLIDEYLPPSHVWTYFMTNEEEEKILAAELWDLFVIGIPLEKTPMLGIIVIALAAGLGFVREKFGYARHCVMCGQATCQRCQRNMLSEKYCGHCMQLFVKRDGVDPSMRNEKMQQVQRYKSRISIISRIMSLVVPGAGHIYAGYSGLGAGLIFVWVYFLTIWIYGGRIFTYPFTVTIEKSFFLNGVMILGMVLVYLFSNIHLSRVSAATE